MGKYPGWRTMTSAQRRNAKADEIFESSFRLKAQAAGWTMKPLDMFSCRFEHPDKPAYECRTGGGVNPWRTLCNHVGIV